MKRALLLFVYLIAPFAVSATELVIVESTDASYAEGDTISDNETIVLEKGTRIILLSEDGITVAISGPFEGPPTPVESDDDYDVFTALGVLVGQAELDSRSIGGVRFASTEYKDIDPSRDVNDGRESPWFLHTGLGGAQCVPQATEQVTYWREDSSRDQILNVAHLASGETATIEWPAGTHTASWPDELPVLLDEVYVLRMKEDLRSVALVVRAVPEAVTGSEYAAVAWFAARGCTSQANLLFATLQQRNPTDLAN